MLKFTWLMLMVVLVACSPAGTATPTFSLVPSSTSALPTATSTSTPTPTSTPIAGVPIERCAEILPDFPEGSVPTGMLVVRVLPHGISLLNFQQQTQRLISGNFDGVGTSPDGKWLSYTDFITPNDKAIFVESPDGKKKIQLPFEADWYDYWNPWLGNEWLSYPVWHGGLDMNTVVLNPFTGEQQLLLPDYPDFIHYWNNPGNMPLYFASSNVLYDPSLRYVIYPLESDDGLYDALWDRETNQKIAKVLTGGNMSWPPPVWFSDGHAFVVAAYPKKDAAREWFMVSLDGKVRQLTHLGEQYANYEIGRTASLSPDGQYLAFGLSSENEPSLVSPELIILDLTTLNAFNTCITFKSPPIWSPDSQYLVIEHPDPQPNRPSIVVLNVDAGWATNIMSNDNENELRYAKGWLDSGE